MDFPVDYFTGDGTSTTFQLSRIPASATSILVHIGGVKQVASTTDPAYYLDGSKLVFVSPPGAYSPIEVNYLGIAGQVNIPGTQSVTQDMLSLQLANTFVYQTTANGATASFTLNAPPVSANSLVVSANGVVQYDYSTNGNTLTFGFTPPVGTFIRVTSLALAQAGVPADGSVTSVKLGANLTITGNTTFDGFSGAPARIRGDFSNATIASRAAFQSSTTNGNTVVGALPNGTGSVTSFQTFNNSDPTNAAAIGIVATSTDMRLSSFITGTGTYLPMTFLTGGSERMRIDTSGNVGIGTSSPGAKLDVSGGNIRAIGGSNALIGAYGANSSSPQIALGNSAGTNHWLFYETLGASGQQGSVHIYDAPSGTNRLTIETTGNVGIGTSSPSFKLSVVGSGAFSGTTNSVYSKYTNTGSDFWVGIDNSAGTDFGTSTAYARVIYSSGAYPLTITTNDVERMRITSTGQLLIGASSAAYSTLNTQINCSSGGSVGGASPSPSVFLNYNSAGGGGQFNVLGLHYNFSTIGNGPGLSFSTLDAGNSRYTTALIGTSTTSNTASAISADLQFYTVSSATLTERVRIESGGNFLVGTTSAYGKTTIDIGSNIFTNDENQAGLTVQGTVTNTRPLILVRSTTSGQDTAFRVSANRSGTQDRWTIGCHIARNSDNLSINYGTSNTGAGTERFYFTSAGAAYNTTGTWGTISDARLKENIVDTTPKLNKVNQLQVRNFNFIGDELKQIGFVAQEIEQVFPGIVETNELKDGTEQKTVKMTILIPILVKAMQEQQSQIEELRAEIQALKGQ